MMCHPVYGTECIVFTGLYLHGEDRHHGAELAVGDGRGRGGWDGGGGGGGACAVCRRRGGDDAPELQPAL